MKLHYYHRSELDEGLHTRLNEFMANNNGWEHRGSVTRSDGYIFHIIKKKSSVKIFAGCKDGWSLARYRGWAKAYGIKNKTKETLLILDQLERIAKTRKSWY